MNFDHVYLTTKGYEAFGSGIIGQKTVTWNECKTYNTDISNWEQTAINNATASSFDSVNQTSIGQVTSTSYVSTNDGNSVRIAITLRNTNNNGVPTYHGLARTLCVFGNVNGSSQLLIIATSDEPDTVPQNSEFKAFVDCYIVQSQDTISTINAPNSWYATANDLNTLKDRVVTTHVEGNVTQGESQTIYGEKTFISQMTAAAIKPRSNNTYSLGDNSFRWDTIYSQDGNFSNDATVSNDLAVGRNITVAGTTSIAGDILPSDNVINLGDNSHRFAKMYITGGNNSDQQTCVVIDNSAAKTTVRPLTNNTCYLGDSTHRWGTAYINTLYVNGTDGELNITDTKVTVRDETSSGSPTSKTLAKYVTDKIQTTSSSASSSADKWTNARNFTIKDSAPTPNAGTTIQVDGSVDVDLILPPTIKATLKGKADEASKADKLTNYVTIDGVGFDGSANITHFCVCSTPANTIAKTATKSNFTLAAGAIVTVVFINTNTASNPTLNVSNTGDYPIYLRSGTKAGSTTSSSWRSGDIVSLVFYNGGWRKLNNSLRTYIDTTDDDNAYPIIFKTYSNINSTLYSSDASLYTAKANNFYYNPSTSTLTCSNLSASNINLRLVILQIIYNKDTTANRYTRNGVVTSNYKSGQEYLLRVPTRSVSPMSNTSVDNTFFSIKSYSAHAYYEASDSESTAATKTIDDSGVFSVTSDTSITILTGIKFPPGNAGKTVYVKALVLIQNNNLI